MTRDNIIRDLHIRLKRNISNALLRVTVIYCKLQPPLSHIVKT